MGGNQQPSFHLCFFRPSIARIQQLEQLDVSGWTRLFSDMVKEITFRAILPSHLIKVTRHDSLGPTVRRLVDG